MSHNITQTVEKAARALVLANLPEWLPETQVYRGIENRESEDMEGQESSLKVRPCVILVCQTAAAVAPNWRGLWDATLEVHVENRRSDTTGDTHRGRAQEVFDIFLTTEAPADLSGAIPDFIVRAVVPNDQSHTQAGRGWLSSITFTLHQVAERTYA